MEDINKEAIKKEITEESNFKAAYDEVAKNLYRGGENRSVRCLAIWASKRRITWILPFESNILNNYNGDYQTWANSVKDEIGSAILNKFGYIQENLHNGYGPRAFSSTSQ